MWPFSNRKVLIVSEKRRELTLDSAFLHQPDVRLLTGSPDADTLELARKKRPALIVGNICERDGQGLDFCHDLRADPCTRTIPLIIVAELELHSGFDAIRADALLSKPIDRRVYFDAVRRFLPMPNRSGRRIPANLRFSYRVDTWNAQAFSRDISVSGAFIKSDRTLPIGTRLDVEFNLPGTGDPVCCSAIVRSGPIRDEYFGPGGFGIEFEEMKEDDVERLERFIELFSRHQRS